MKVRVIEEHGHEAALLGLSLSHQQPIENMPEVAKRLAMKAGGHNKFLESMIAWIDITAPRFWWSQCDTYRHVSKQSASTMHTLLGRQLKQSDFSCHIPPGILETLNLRIRSRQLGSAKALLPEAFLQRRIVCLSYSALQHIIQQRAKHKLAEWGAFIKEIMRQVEHPEYLMSDSQE